MKSFILSAFVQLALVSTAFSQDIARPLSDKTIESIATQLNDNNISTGTTLLWLGQLKPSNTHKNIQTLSKNGMLATFKNKTGVELPQNAKLKILTGTFTVAFVNKMVDALLESNDYNTRNNKLRQEQSRYLWAALRKFSVSSSNSQVGHTSTRIKDDGSGELRTIQYFLIKNSDGKVLQFFTIQGSM